MFYIKSRPMKKNYFSHFAMFRQRETCQNMPKFMFSFQDLFYIQPLVLLDFRIEVRITIHLKRYPIQCQALSAVSVTQYTIPAFPNFQSTLTLSVKFVPV